MLVLELPINIFVGLFGMNVGATRGGTVHLKTCGQVKIVAPGRQIARNAALSLFLDYSLEGTYLMPKPIRYAVSSTSAADFDSWLMASDPAATSCPMFFAEGDSWFNKFYPTGDNLLDQLDLPRGCRLIDHSWSGDRASDMFAPNRIAAVAQYLDAYQYKAILLSAGGNDIINKIGGMLTTTGNVATLSAPLVKTTFDEVEKLLRDFCTARTDSQRNRTTRIFIHAYDFVTPRNAPVKGGIVGPWVYPRLREKGVTLPAVQKQLVTDLLRQWMARLETLADPLSPSCIPGFHVMLTQGMLTPANAVDTGRSGDWEDEIHPTKDAFRRMAAKLYTPTLTAILNGA